MKDSIFKNYLLIEKFIHHICTEDGVFVVKALLSQEDNPKLMLYRDF